MTERGDTLESEIDVADAGSNLGWPCLDGTQVAAASACLAGVPPATVYGNHSAWRRPLLVHTGRPALAGVAAYSGLAYPADYFGDVFYLLRDGARIYRVDLAPPCFIPGPSGRAPLAFHDSPDDGDFTVFFDRDGDGSFDEVSFTTLTAITQGPDPLGRQVLYVAAKEGNSSALTEHSAIFRIEYAASTPPIPASPPAATRTLSGVRPARPLARAPASRTGRPAARTVRASDRAAASRVHASRASRFPTGRPARTAIRATDASSAPLASGGPGAARAGSRSVSSVRVRCRMEATWR